MRKYLCGTPEKFCLGSYFGTSAFLAKKDSIKMHPTSHDAFNCHRSYLIDQLGYEAISSRELQSPHGGEILVLTKQSRFGAELRRGKLGGRAQPKYGLRGVIF